MALLDPMSALMLEIDPARIAAVRAKAEEEHAVVITLFFPNQAGA